MAVLMDIVKKGSTDRSVTLRIVDSGDGTPETGVVYNTSGIDLWYRREGAAKTSITEATLSALTDAHADGGFLHIGDGEYRLDLPDAAFATGANHVDVGGTVTGMIVIGGRVRLVGYDPEDGVRAGLTALPNAAAEAAGGLFTRGTGAGQINQDANGRIDAHLNDAAHGGTSAVLTLERVVVASTTTDEPAVKLTGNGEGEGLRVKGGADANGGIFQAGASAGAGKAGLLVTGDPSSIGLLALSGADAPAVEFFGSGVGAGLLSVGGPTGYGIHAAGGATSGDGLHASAQGGGDGIQAVGAGGGYDINADIQGTLSGGVVLANAAHGGVAATLTLEHLEVVSDTTDQPAVLLQGDGSGDGLISIGGPTGNGATLQSGASGGHGLEAIGIVDADIKGDLEGNITGSVGSVTALDTAVRAAVGLASANLDTQLGDIPTNAELATSQAAADDATLAALAALNNLSAAQVNAEVVDALTVDILADSVAADGTRPTIGQALLELTRFLMERSVSSTTMTVKKEDGTTSSMTFTLNDATTPTAITRAS